MVLTRRPAGSDGSRARWGGVVVAVLLIFNVRVMMTTEVGPDPGLEALHSPVEAVERCRRAVSDKFSGRDLLFADPGQPEYLGGGEYEVRLTVVFRDEARHAGEGLLCQAQFRQASGWKVEDVAPE